MAPSFPGGRLRFSAASKDRVQDHPVPITSQVTGPPTPISSCNCPSARRASSSPTCQRPDFTN
ncbi:hypothetical protein JCM18918_4227 [Cutibacterium acnes JCM 18918]|nr:hypothetical protein JCM18918_4227 [Cutibacterium acnes JCM 18918]